MGIYRCAACGSPNVMTDTQANGVNYNYLKGAVGTVLLGVGGAAAGKFQNYLPKPAALNCFLNQRIQFAFPRMLFGCRRR